MHSKKGSTNGRSVPRETRKIPMQSLDLPSLHIPRKSMTRLPPREVILQYNEELESVGKIQSLKGEELVLREYIYTKLWSRVKFVLCDSELDSDGKLAKKVMKDVRVDEQVRQEYWARNRHKVLKWINQKRNNTIGAVKREFLRWAVNVLTVEKKDPTIDMLKNHRGGDLNRFTLWADSFFRGGYGAVQFRSLTTTKKISSILTIYDEAFIICVVHNAFDRWVREANDIAKYGKVNKEVPLPPTKWTETGSAAKKYEGWDEKGISFFNKAVEEVIKLRETEGSKDVERDYLEEKKLELNEKKRGGVKRITTAITALNGLDDDDDDASDHDNYNTAGQKRSRVSIGSGSTETTMEEQADNNENEDDDESDDGNSNDQRSRVSTTWRESRRRHANN